MDRNVYEVWGSRELRDAAQQLLTRVADMARLMVAGQFRITRWLPVAARHPLDSKPTG